jgi:WD40 repeat protein
VRKSHFHFLLLAFTACASVPYGVVRAGAEPTVALRQRWAVVAGKRPTTFQIDTFAADGSTLVATPILYAGAEPPALFNASTGQRGAVLERRETHASLARVFDVAMSPNRSQVVTREPTSANASELTLLDATSGRVTRRWQGPGDPSFGASLGADVRRRSTMAWLPDARGLVVAGLDHIQLFDTTSGSVVRDFPRVARAIAAVSVRAVDGAIIEVDCDHSVHAWSATGEGRGSSTLGSPSSADSCGVVAISGDGQRVAMATASNPQVEIWDLTTAARLGSLAGDAPVLLDLAFSRDGRRVVTLFSDVVRVWDTDRGELLVDPTAWLRTQIPSDGSMPSRITRACLSPDGLGLALADDVGGLRVFDLVPR